MRIFGCDPGKTGAIVCMDEYFDIIDAMNFKTIVTRQKTKTRKMREVLDSKAIYQFIQLNMDNDDNYFFLEQVGAMRKGGNSQGSNSTFSFGSAAGALQAAIIISGYLYTEVLPISWRNMFNLASGKEESRLLCLKDYPGMKVLQFKAKGQAVSDAILIAKYGYIKVIKNQNR